MSASEKPTFSRLTIEKMPEGGFTVSEAHIPNSGFLSLPLFASTDIADALGFVRSKLGPVVLASDLAS